MTYPHRSFFGVSWRGGEQITCTQTGVQTLVYSKSCLPYITLNIAADLESKAVHFFDDGKLDTMKFCGQYLTVNK